MGRKRFDSKEFCLNIFVTSKHKQNVYTLVKIEFVYHNFYAFEMLLRRVQPNVRVYI